MPGAVPAAHHRRQRHLTALQREAELHNLADANLHEKKRGHARAKLNGAPDGGTPAAGDIDNNAGVKLKSPEAPLNAECPQLFFGFHRLRLA